MKNTNTTSSEGPLSGNSVVAMHILDLLFPVIISSLKMIIFSF